jgi:hypothetical protein
MCLLSYVCFLGGEGRDYVNRYVTHPLRECKYLNITIYMTDELFTSIKEFSFCYMYQPILLFLVETV